VAAELAGADVEGIAAGLHAVVRLPPGSDERATILAARRGGVAVEGLSEFRHTALAAPAALVLGYANLPEPAIARAIAELARALR
jgi:GntR family transcriptional regulator/MocR family aminotransferase